MKLMRKLWVGTLPPFCIEAMRAKVFSMTGMDIDFDFGKRSIEIVVQHYTVRLQMPQQDVILHAQRMSQKQAISRSLQSASDDVGKLQRIPPKEEQKAQPSGPFIELKDLKRQREESLAKNHQTQPRKIFVRNDRSVATPKYDSSQ